MAGRHRSFLAGGLVVLLTLLLGVSLLPAIAPQPTPRSAGSSASPGAPTTDAAVPSPSGPQSAQAAPSVPPGQAAPAPFPAPIVPPGQAAVAAPALPAFRHVYLIVMENKEFGSVIGSGAAPYLNSLAKRYGLARSYTAVAHPSEPNYLALFSGSTHGVRDDGVHVIHASNLADQLQAHGRTWAVYAQNVPGHCYRGATASGGADGGGTYARKHEPAISFADIVGSSTRCARIHGLGAFNPAAASFELIVPNMCNDMHDCSVATGDAFLRRFVPRITGSAAFANSVIFIVWDEGTSKLGGGGKVPLIAVSPLVRAGTVSTVAYSHYSLLRTIENAWGLGCLGHSCTANDLRKLFSGF